MAEHFADEGVRLNIEEKYRASDACMAIASDLLELADQMEVQ
jgi:hypothetical protein